MVIHKNMSELGDEAMTESSYSGIQIDDEFCPFHISVYPSQQTEHNHRTLTPLYFSLVTVIIFAVTAATFVMYDFWVERRQQVVMKTAVTTTALVSSLFPDVVMDRMISTGGGGGGDSMSTSSHGNQPNTRLKSFLNDGKNDDNIVSGATAVGSDRNLHTSTKYSKPIAELFRKLFVSSNLLLFIMYDSSSSIRIVDMFFYLPIFQLSHTQHFHYYCYYSYFVFSSSSKMK